jgi:predicted dehydrogenase
MVRWGLIGAGDITRVKASPREAFTQEGSRVVAVARSDIRRATEYAEMHGIPRPYGSAEDLCEDRDVDAVYVATPHHLHFDHALMAIRARNHVLCE